MQLNHGHWPLALAVHYRYKKYFNFKIVYIKIQFYFQASTIKAWKGEESNVGKAQEELLKRAKVEYYISSLY